MATHGMTIAKASKDDFEKVYNLLNGINKNNKGKASPIYIPTKKRK